MIENATLDGPATVATGVAGRIAAATAARTQRPDYAAEVRALLDAARAVLAETGKLRIADVVAGAGLSNDAFYRHFASKDALVAALTEQGVELVAASIERRMAAEPDAEAQVRCWATGLLAQASEANAAPTLAVLGAATTFPASVPAGLHESARRPLARLLHEPFRALGSPTPDLDATLVTHAVTSRVAGHLWSGTAPTADEVEHVVDFCLRAARRP